MVASHRLNSQRPSVNTAVGTAALAGGSRPERTGNPGLYLVVDNSRSATIDRGSGVAVALPKPIWHDVVDHLEAVLRRWQLEVTNRLDRSAMAGELRLMIPAVVVAAAVIFGALGTVMLSQGDAGPGNGAVAGQQVSLMNGSVESVGSSASEVDAVIVVSAGESLWSIATERFPGEDPRRVVDLLVEANGSSVIQAGQRLVIPVELGTTTD